MSVRVSVWKQIMCQVMQHVAAEERIMCYVVCGSNVWVRVLPCVYVSVYVCVYTTEYTCICECHVCVSMCVCLPVSVSVCVDMPAR